tara:strand:- start:1183 stop:1971 length:789 start_codon:yes stop_codon:yes gene_type:complete
MAVGTIVGIIILVIILYLVLSWWSNSYVYLSGLNSGKKEIKIPAKKLSKGADRASNFSYSIWFYINDWNYRFGEKKIIFERGSKHHLCPEVSLDKFENNLKIKLAIYNHSESSADGVVPHGTTLGSNKCPSTTLRPSAGDSGHGGFHECNVSNVPLQRWVNLIVSVYGRSLDVYLDGKLTRTCILPNTALVNPKSSVKVTPDNGFDGWTSNFQYLHHATNPQEAWNIYQSGYGGSLLGDLFNKYVIKVEFLKDGEPEGSFEI